MTKTYSFDVTPDQDTLLAWVVARHNTEHETTFTNAQFVQAQIADLLAPHYARYKQAVLSELAVKFQAATAQTQTDVKSLLGVAL